MIMFSLKDNLTCRITVTRPTTGGIGNIPVILIAFLTVVTNNVWETFLAPKAIKANSTLTFASVLVTPEVTCQEK